MRRWWLMVALLLSLGFNLGLLAAVAGGWWASRDAGEVVAAGEEGAAAPGEEGVPAAGGTAGIGEEAGGGEIDGGEIGGGEPEALSPDSRELGWNGGEGVEVPPREWEQDPGPDGRSGPEEVDDEAGTAPGGEPTAPAPDEGPSAGEGTAPRDPAPRSPFGPGDPGGPGGPEGFQPGAEPPGPPLERMADHLGLEGEVRERFLDLQRRFVRDRFEIQYRGRALTTEMHRELSSRQPDPDRVERLIDERARLWREQEILTARTILETRSILEPEQQRRYLQVLRHLMSGSREGRPGLRPGARLRSEGRPGPRPGMQRRPEAGPGPGSPAPEGEPPFPRRVP